MNFNRNSSWPHPILSSFGDDIDGSDFDVAIEPTPGYEEWVIKFEAKGRDDYIDSIVGAGKARYLLHLECRGTFLREAFPVDPGTGEIRIPGDRLLGMVESSLVIVATTLIESYKHPRQHADYENTAFKINAGEPLAISPVYRFDAFYDAEPLRELPSIFNIRQGSSDITAMQVRLDGNRIGIELPTGEYGIYKTLRMENRFRTCSASIVLLPALLEALYFIKANEGEDLENLKATTRWIRVLTSQLDRLNIDIFSDVEPGACLHAAQQLLRRPLERSLNIMNSLLSEQ